MSRLILIGIVALSVGPMHLVPWSGTSVRAISSLNTDAGHIFNPNIPAMLGGIIWALLVAYIFGRKERKRLGIIRFDYNHKENLSGEQKSLRRPKLILVNAVLTISLITVLLMGVIPAPALFVIAGIIALMINYSKLPDQQKILKAHGSNIFLVSSMIFAAGVYSGILTESKMIEGMASRLVNLIPKEHASFIPTITAIISMPASMLFTPDAYYYGVVPVLSHTCTQLGIDPLEIGRASMLGQMTTGFPLSPLTASTFLLIGLAEVELGEHQKFIFKWAWGTTIVMTIIALATGSIHI
jgi:CitMHS family citrate-Mg2+:H+ or citrate-Ca2+:H+ symporter